MTRRPHVAFFSPLTPVKSGIADYSEELLPALSRLMDVDAIVDQDAAVNASALLPVRIRSLAQYGTENVPYDVHVYQVGNNVRHHGYMLPVMERVPGVLVLHDYCLNHLVLGATLARGELTALEQALAPQYGPAARRLAWQLLLNIRDPLTISFAGKLIRRSDIVVVHSAYARDRVLADHPATTVRVVPMGIRPSKPPSADRARALRSRFGLPAADVIVASVSTPAHNKRLDLLVRAFQRALRTCPNLRLLILGGGLLQQPVGAEIERQPESRMRRTGWLSGDDYRDLIALSDVVVDLRYPAAAETSASLLRALAAGIPAVISEQGPFSELPESCCIRVPVGEGEEELIANEIGRLAASRDLRRRMGDSAASFAVARCSLSGAADAVADVLTEHMARRTALAGRVASRMATPPPGRAIVSGVYKACKVGRLWRTYGSSTTWRRIREEVRGDV